MDGDRRSQLAGGRGSQNSRGGRGGGSQASSSHADRANSWRRSSGERAAGAPAQTAHFAPKRAAEGFAWRGGGDGGSHFGGGRGRGGYDRGSPGRGGGFRPREDAGFGAADRGRGAQRGGGSGGAWRRGGHSGAEGRTERPYPLSHAGPPPPQTSPSSGNEPSVQRTAPIVVGVDAIESGYTAWRNAKDKTNLHRFLERVVPSPQLLRHGEPSLEVCEDDATTDGEDSVVAEESKEEGRDGTAAHGEVGEPGEKESQPTPHPQPKYKLEDLWKWYDMPYGLPISILLDGEDVDVFYAPYLSACRIYLLDQQSSSAGDQEFPSLFYEFNETLPPDRRLPLYDKVSHIASAVPAIKFLESADIHPTSWFSISWYPILCHNYTLNVNRGMFLTYHHFTDLKPRSELYCGTADVTQTNETRSSGSDGLAPAVASLSVENSENTAESGANSGDSLCIPVAGWVPYKVRSATWYRPASSVRSDNPLVSEKLDLIVPLHLMFEVITNNLFNKVHVDHHDRDHLATWVAQWFDEEIARPNA